ncbi:smoothelin isoform X2 [Agelaius phoeniceus]|uniref:smoothelin isoform X2 n=1 Tax=Agelaius phoeniceus TaxID=39638 RepID=UPI004054FFF7
MSQESLLGMDEGALRKLLEATLDLAERRRIRSAIRELQRQELERDEETLASKRFRPERSSHRQDNKENWPQSRRLEEEQQAALAALSEQLEAITSVEELTKLLRAAGEYEERKLIRAAIRKLRAEEIEAATLAGNVQSSRRDGTKPPTVPGERKIFQRDNAETPVFTGSEKSCGEDSTKPPGTDKSGKSSQQDDAEPPLAGPEESGYGEAVKQAPAQQPKGSVARKQEDVVEQEHVPAGMQELCSQQAGDPQKPGAQGNLVLLALQPVPEPSPEPEDDGEDLQQGQPQAAWKEGNLGSPASAPEPSVSQSPRGEQFIPGQPSAGSQLHVGIHCQVLEPGGRHERPSVASVPTQEVMGTPARPNTHRGGMSLLEPGQVWSSAVPGCRRMLLAAYLPLLLPAQNPSLPPIHVQWGEGAEALRGCSHPGKCWFMMGSLGHRSTSREHERDCMHGQALRGHCASCGQPRGGCMRSVISRGGASMHRRGHPRMGGSSVSQGAPRGAACTVRGQAGGDTRWRPQSGDPAPIPAAPLPAGPPPSPAAGSVRERAQRFGPAGAGGAGGRAGAGAAQWQRGPRTAPPAPAQNARGSGGAEQRPAPRPAGSRLDAMKTFFTIEIKDGRVQPLAPRITATPGGQRAEVTLDLRNAPIRITTIPSSVSSICNISSVSSNVTKDPCAHFEGTEEPSVPVAHPPTFSSTRQQSTLHLSRSNSSMEPEVVEQQQAPRREPELPNGMEKVQVREVERRSKLNVEELSKIEDEDILDKMLDRTTDFEERRLIRNAMRELRQRKRDQREKERDQRLQEARSQSVTGRAGHATETTTTQSTQSADGSACSTVTKTERLIQSSDGSKTSRTTTMESSYVKRSDNGNSTFVQTKSSYSSSSKKTGSIFDREDESASRQSSLAALERRQAEKKKELMKAQSLPKTSASQARKAMMEKLQKEGGSSNPAATQTTVQRSSSFGVPNANSIKQMLLDWCRAKTRGYEHVDIQNFSSSWSDGMAFCALVHNFFPDAFDYSKLTPQNRRQNFEVAFSSAEKHADCPQLLDVEDMVRMREPDWKCVYTYIQEFYRCLVQKGLVKTKKS